MLKKVTVCAFAVLLVAGVVIAHGNATHIMGTVTAVDKDTVTVQDKDGKTVKVMLEKGTKYLTSANKPSKLDEMKVGTRIMIDAEMNEKMKMFSAEEIRIGVAAPAAGAKK